MAVGENVRLSVPTGSPTEVLAVPRDALVLRREGASVFRIGENGTAERVDVVRGAGAGELVAVTGRISPGDRVVVRGAERLRPGQPVDISATKN
jgi:multidrug efflux pump subunit AcrA (membrane-fusion protein)